MAVAAGRISKLFGPDGSVMLSLYAGFPADFDPTATPLFVTIDALEVPLWCDRFERRGTAGAVVAFADLDTEVRAGELVGLEFRLAGEESDAADDTFYLEDLIGFSVEAEEMDPVGGRTPRRVRAMLADYYDSEANPLFELQMDGRTALVPAVEEFIVRIDFEHRTMKLLLPEGLLDLQ